MANIVKVLCECGKEVRQSGLRMHQTGHAHKAWEAEHVPPPVSAPAEPIDTALKAVLEAAKTETPMGLARMTRAVFADRKWPNEDHPGTVAAWLTSHGIPILTMPASLTADEARIWRDRELTQLEKDGWRKGVLV